MDTLLSREIRVFLSSTFQDMDAERNYLMQYVFPEVRRRCAERGAGFTEIDLRWGITEADAKNGRTVAICLAEIDRCRDYPPFFIGFLGERYGWIPQVKDLEGYWLQNDDSPYLQAIEEAMQQGISVTELEIRFGVLNRMDMHQHAYFFLRSPQLTQQLQIAASDDAKDLFYDKGNGKLEKLKRELVDNNYINVQEYASLQDFGERIKQILLAEIDRRFPMEEALDVFTIRRRAHHLFAQSRRNAYVPLPSMREKILTQIHSNLAGEKTGAILIAGASGLGKSAFMADLAAWLPDSLQACVIDHYIGADGHRSLESWRDRILHWLDSILPESPSAPDDDKAKWVLLSLRLEQARKQYNKPIILLIDALDQILDGGVALSQLGEAYWPTGVVLIASTILEAEYMATLWSVHALCAPTRDERRGMIQFITQTFRKSLESYFVDRLLDTEAATTPLFLRIVLENLRIHGKYETLDQRLNVLLSMQDTAELFAFLLGEWDRSYGDDAHPDMASRLAALLAASRQGLAEYELAELLSASSDPVSPESQHPRLPAARISLLLAVFQPYLLRNAGQEALMHAALVRGSLSITDTGDIRNWIINYFQGSQPRALAERIYQQIQLLADCSVEKASLTKATMVEELLLPQNVSLLFEVESKLLRDALALLGANKHVMTEKIDKLIRAWQSTEVMWGGIDDNIAKWMLDMRYLSLSEAWSKGRLAYLQAYVPDDHHAIAVCLKNIANVLFRTKQFDEAHSLFDQALSLLNQVALPDVQEIAKIQNNVANIYMNQERFEEAKVLHEQNLELKRRAKQPNLPSIAHSLNNLGAVYSKQEQLDLAISHHEEALKFRRLSLPPNHPDIAGSLTNISAIYSKQGQYEAAIRYRLEAMHILRRALPVIHPKIGDNLLSLANIYQKQGEFGKVEAMYQEALEIYREALPENHPSLATLLNNIAIVRNKSGQLENAEALYIEVIKIRRNDKVTHPNFASNLFSLAKIYQKQGKLDQVEPLYKEAIQIHRYTVPLKPLSIANCLYNLGIIYRGQKRYSEAESVYEEALNLRRQCLPNNHPDIANSLFSLAITHSNNKKLEQAESLYLESLAIRRNELPVKPISVANCLNNLGMLYNEQKRYDEAEKLHEESLNLRRRSLPEYHISTAYSLSNLADSYCGQNQLHEAELLYQESLQIRRNATPVKPTDIANCLYKFAELYQKQGKLKEAESLMTEAWDIRQKALLPDDPDLAKTIKTLTEIHQQIDSMRHHSGG